MDARHLRPVAAAVFIRAFFGILTPSTAIAQKPHRWTHPAILLGLCLSLALPWLPTVAFGQEAPSFSAALGTPARTLSGVVGPGTYHFSVLAANACGSSAATAVQTVVVP